MVTELADRKPRAFETIIYGGLVIGVLDFLDAVIFIGGYYGIGPIRVFQGVAAGLLGREAAAAGGTATGLLGIFLHFVIAFLIAAVYYLAATRISFLIRKPVISGLVFGVVCYFVMNYAVVPLSAIGAFPAFNLPLFLNGIIGHALLVGLPAALIATRSTRKV